MYSQILNLLNSKEFQTLKSYYEETTLFNVIGAERSENRHSAFLRWLFSPTSSHGLGDKPLKLLLRLLVNESILQKIDIFGEVTHVLMAGQYDINLLEPIELEKNVGQLKEGTEVKDMDRIDIWTVIEVTYDEDEPHKIVFPLVIENKIYSGEGERQTERYYDAMNAFCNAKPEGSDYRPLGVFLSPDKKKATCNKFICLCYQELLDFIIDPIASMTMPDTDRSFVDSYIRNLSRPSSDSNRDFSVIAISKYERTLVNSIYNEERKYKELIDNMLAVLFPQIKSIIKSTPNVKEEDQKMLQKVWDANEDIFKSIVYIHYQNHQEELKKAFKGNNRDSTKYKVFDADGNEIFTGKRLSKGMTACAIFKAYLKKKPNTTFEELCNAFPCEELNNYYWYNYFENLFAECPSNYSSGADFSLKFTVKDHKRKGTPCQAEGYFYLKEPLPLGNGTKFAVCVKMWRKGDFDSLVAYVQKNYNFIKIVECL